MDFVGVCKQLLILVSWTTKIVDDNFIIIIIGTDAYQSPTRPGLHKFRSTDLPEPIRVFLVLHCCCAERGVVGGLPH